MPANVFNRRRTWLPAASVLFIATLSACGARQVQLLFPPQNDTGEYWKCPVADASARPEHRENQCTRVYGGLAPDIGNSGRVAHIDVRTCELGEFRSITIVDADSSSPTLYVTCGQPVGGQTAGSQTGGGTSATPPNLNGGLPSSPPSASDAVPTPDSPTPQSDLNGGLPPPEATPTTNP
ncbi:MAG: hypothetical protein OXU20_21600 [Myxococcales bacterium]|nr:hypothetical protein [Myxococcales bacterium]